MLAVIVLAAGFVLPRFGDLGTLAVDAAARRLAEAITLARERAILGGRPMRLVLDLDAGRWALASAGREEEPATLPPRVRLRGVTTDGATPVAAGLVTLDLDPAGDALAARVDLADDRGHAASVVVPPAGAPALVVR